MLTQKVGSAKGKDVESPNGLLNQMQAAVNVGGAKNTLHPIPGMPMFVTYFDASLGKTESMSAQEAEIHFLTTKDVEFSRPRAVCRSSIAARCTEC